MKKRKIAGIVFCASMMPFALQAATVAKQSGGVLINTGGGFVSVASQIEAAPGSQIMVQPGGLATISYANSCVVRVGSGIWLVQAAAPCANGATEVDFTTRMNQGTEPTPPPGVAPVVVGGVVVAGVVGAALLINQLNKDNDKPASP